MAARVHLVVGTKKGLYLLAGGPARKSFEVAGPMLPGKEVYAGILDTRGKPTLLAGSHSAWWGTKLLRSTDLGRTWKESGSAPVFSKKDGRTLARIWSLEPGSKKRDLWCGIEPASLFYSPDLGDTWEPIKGLNEHPHAKTWQPGNGGLCLHTILRQDGRLHVGISAAGHYRSDDGGKSWAPRNKGIPAGFLPDNLYPDYGQ